MTFVYYLFAFFEILIENNAIKFYADICGDYKAGPIEALQPLLAELGGDGWEITATRISGNHLVLRKPVHVSALVQYGIIESAPTDIFWLAKCHPELRPYEFEFLVAAAKMTTQERRDVINAPNLLQAARFVKNYTNKRSNRDCILIALALRG